MDKNRKEELQKAGKELIESLQSLEQVDKNEVLTSWQKIQVRFTEKKRAKRRRLYIIAGSAAAAVLCVLFLLPESYVQPTLNRNLLDNISKESKEIILLSEDQQIELENEANLKYDENGISDRIAVSSEKGESIQSSKLNTLVVPKGRKINITFSDGSHMYVNSGSQVIYPSVFEKDKREILVKGEVYVNVVKDAKRPFIIQTQDMSVRVLGTSFNLSAYGTGTSSVVLVEGSVEVTSDSTKPVKIRPNQRISLTNDTYSVEEVDTYKYTSWIDDLFVIEDMQCKDVFNYLQSYYGVEFITTPEINSIPMGGKINLRNEINQVLDNFCYTFNLKYTWKDNSTIIISRE